MLDGLALIKEVVDFEHTDSSFPLVFPYQFCDFLEQFFELSAVDVFLKEGVKDLVHDVVGVFGRSRGSSLFTRLILAQYSQVLHFLGPLLFLLIIRIHH